MASASVLADRIGIAPACAALALPRASYYRALAPEPEVVVRPAPPPPPRALSEAERAAVRDELNSDRFVDQAPREVYATLLEEGVHLCHWRTMYRILTDHDEVRERRDQARRPNYARPEIMATGPNQLWSWDITKLRGPTRGMWFFLYVMMDVFSRYVVGWLVAERESEALARELIDAACAKQGIGPGQLTLHADRGAPMTAGSVAGLLDRLGVNQSHSRPHVSNDNPYSEAGFRSAKYHPTFPGSFGSVADAYGFCGPYFLWCNEEHHHTGLALLTPATVHNGRTAAVLAERQAALDAAYAAHPERFVHGPPKAPEPPSVVWINPPLPDPAPDIEAPPAPALSQPGAEPESRAAVVGPAERTLDAGEHRAIMLPGLADADPIMTSLH